MGMRQGLQQAHTIHSPIHLDYGQWEKPEKPRGNTRHHKESMHAHKARMMLYIICHQYSDRFCNPGTLINIEIFHRRIEKISQIFCSYHLHPVSRGQQGLLRFLYTPLLSENICRFLFTHLFRIFTHLYFLNIN